MESNLLKRPLFKKDSIKWDKAIHSVPFTRGEGVELEADSECVIIHHNYSTISEYLGKMDRYTDHLKESVLSHNYKFSITDLISKPIDEFITQFFARRGYKDGIHGLILSLLQAFTELVVYLKIWEDKGSTEIELKGMKLNETLKLKTQEFKWWKYQMEIDNSNPIKGIWLKLVRKMDL